MPLLRSSLILAVLAALFFASVPGHAQTLRVMTFNVRLPTDADGPNRWEQRRDLMVKTIRDEAPDVIGTQELFAVQGDYLVAKLPQYAWFGRGRSGKSGDDERMGVFYHKDRLRVLESGDFWLSDTPDVPGSITWGHPYPRMVTWALFEQISDGRRFHLFNTHLPYRTEDDEARLRGALALVQRARNLPPEDVPVIVTGDFNTTPDSCTYTQLTGLLQDAWTAAPRRDGPEATFHAFTGKPDRRIDWILSRGMVPMAVRTIDSNKNGRYPSDHFPVVADYAWPDAH